MKIAILTDFRSWDDAYSVSTVVQRQGAMLRRKGHEISLVVRSDFKDDPGDSLGIRYVTATHQFHLNPGDAAPGDFHEQVTILIEDDIGYRGLLCEGFDVVITHDLMTSAWGLTNCVAIHRLALEFPKIRWLHWCHSMPEPKPDILLYPSTMRWVAAPNSTYILPSHPTTALTDRIAGSTAATVFNPCDPREFFGFLPESWLVASRWGLLDCDFLQIYPFSQERWQGKGVRHLLKFFGKLKQHGYKVCLVLANSHTESAVGRADCRRMHDYAVRCGLRDSEDVIILSEASSEIGENWKAATPWDVVRDIMTISNVFVFPSGAECCSLIQAEAAVAGVPLVLNQSLAESISFASSNVVAYDFSAHDPDYDDYFYEKTSRAFATWFFEQPAAHTTWLARTRYYNEDWIYQYQLAPLLEAA